MCYRRIPFLSTSVKGMCSQTSNWLHKANPPLDSICRASWLLLVCVCRMQNDIRNYMVKQEYVNWHLFSVLTMGLSVFLWFKKVSLYRQKLVFVCMFKCLFNIIIRWEIFFWRSPQRVPVPPKVDEDLWACWQHHRKVKQQGPATQATQHHLGEMCQLQYQCPLLR